MYGTPAMHDDLPWEWVVGQLRSSGTYWVVPRGGAGAPHSRPVWGVWRDDELLLTIGSPVLRRELASDPIVTVHLDSGTDVVVVEGTASVADGADLIAGFIEDYDPKYDWSYDLDDLGPPMRITPVTVIAYRSGGWAGREGFRQSGKWVFETT
jgi:Pyridoxamine 5'-phosphate oxidase